MFMSQVQMYDPTLEISLCFFKTVQNKLHWAITEQTAAEIITQRADNAKEKMGLATWSGAIYSKNRFLNSKKLFKRK